MVQVLIKFTGDVWMRMHAAQMEFAFEGDTLGQLLEVLFAQYELRDLLLDESGKIRFRSRIAVNGRFSDTLQGMNTPVQSGDVIVLMRPGLGAN